MVSLPDYNHKRGKKWDKPSSSKSSDSSRENPQDADYDPGLSEELETIILARFPRSKHWKLSTLNKHYWTLFKSGEIDKIRKQIGIKEPSVFTFTMGDSHWWVFENYFKSGRRLPVIPSDYSFEFSDKESFCAGSQLFVCGKELQGVVLWTYELGADQWYRGPSMIIPRCLFASTTCGNFAYIAGGLEQHRNEPQGQRWWISDSVERYNSEAKSWEALPKMIKKRKLCSACYLDNKLYVIGGQDQNSNYLMCGEYYDERTKTWTLIPDMLTEILQMTPSYSSPPLVAVANNSLYALDTCSNVLKVYLKETNSWKNLGISPVRADAQRGWGVAFKSLGKELLVIGSTPNSGMMNIYTCSPDADHDAKKLQWMRIICGSNQLNHFVHNCAVIEEP